MQLSDSTNEYEDFNALQLLFSIRVNSLLLVVYNINYGKSILIVIGNLIQKMCNKRSNKKLQQKNCIFTQQMR